MNPKRKMLLVDDEKLLCELGRKQFVRRGFEVTTAFSVGEACDLLNQDRSWDCIVSDYRMKDGDASAIFRLIKKLKIEASVVLVSGYPDIDLPDDVKDVVDNLFEKPIDYDAIEECLRR